MTALIITDSNFKRFAKNLKKLKPELSVVSSQEELAMVFGFKNLHHFKQNLLKNTFSISAFVIRILQKLLMMQNQKLMNSSLVLKNKKH